MTKEELNELKKKLSHLSEKEEKERDLYLRKVALGEVQGPDLMKGYPSIDKPWLKYFDEDAFNLNNKQKRTVFEELCVNNSDNLSDLAIEFFGSKINFKQFLNNIDKTAASLTEYGIKKGDYVAICTAGIPEAAYLFYALSKIGAVGNFFPPYLDKESIKKNINIVETKNIIVMDSFYPYIEETISDTSVENIIVLPTLNSSVLRFIKKGPKIKNNEVLWNQFIKDGKYQKNIQTQTYEPNSPLAVVYSSGTSGYLKGIVLSNDSFQNSINAYLKSGVEISRHKKMYQLIPPWASTGLSTAMHLPLSAGSSVFMDPRFDANIFTKNIINKHINYVIATTSLYDGFFVEKNVKGKKWPDLLYPFEGGEKINAETIQSLENVFREHGNNAKLRVGYGQCECGATIATETANTNHSLGSVGIPLPGVTVKIVDDEYNELPYNERGYVLVNTPCGMLEYFGNNEMTNDYFYVDSNGVKWSKTGDIGYIDEDGNIFIDGRARDFTMINDKKIYNFDIENILMTQKDIKECEVLPKNVNGENTLAVHIVFEDQNLSDHDIDVKLHNIQNLIYHSFNDSDYVPYIFKIRNSFPYAKSSKRDTKAISLEEDGFIYLEKYKDLILKRK